jgi:hypothetical protein
VSSRACGPRVELGLIAAIYVFAMTDADHQHEQPVVVDFVKDSVGADSHSPLIVGADELLGARGSWTAYQ